MKSDLKTRHGGKILADALAAQGVKLAFGVPGESYLPVLDGLHDLQDRLRFVICRQEGGASYMAEAYGKLTGEPGVLFVTRGPGATNGAIGVHTGLQDSTPMVVFIGQVPNEFAEREAFQEIDYRRMYGQMAKWVAQIDRVERIPEYVSRAFHTAMAGPAGPGGARASRGHAVLARRPSPMCRSTTWCAPRLRRRRCRKLRKLLEKAQSAVRPPRRRRLGPRAPRRSCRSGSRRAACRSAPRSAARTCSTTAARATPATSASASIRSSRSA